jgi:hypothetical protein
VHPKGWAERVGGWGCLTVDPNWEMRQRWKVVYGWKAINVKFGVNHISNPSFLKKSN